MSTLRAGVLFAVLSAVAIPTAAPTPSGRIDAHGSSTTAVAIASAYLTTCAIVQGGVVQCWGDDQQNELGPSIETQSNCNSDSCASPQDVVGVTGATQIVGTGYSFCALESGGTVACWGTPGDPVLGAPASASFAAQTVQNLSGAVQIAGGFEHVCALLGTGSVECWGDNTAGELGSDHISGPYTCTASTPTYPAQTCSFVPVVVPGLTHVVQVTSGSAFNCVLLVDGSVWCWGDDGDDQLGESSATLPACSNLVCSIAPVEVAGLTDVTSIGAGTSSVCALEGSGTVYCWGANAFGELGQGTNSGPSTCDPRADEAGGCSATPIEVPGIDDATSLFVGWFHACVLDSSGTPTCWGSDTDSMLGDDAGAPLSHCINGEFEAGCLQGPVGFSGLAGPAAQLSLGADSTCAQLRTGVVECVGGNEYGQLGEALDPGSYASEGTPGVVVLADEPTAPTALTLDVSNLAASIRWHAPRSDGTAPVGTYVATPDPSAKACVRSAALRTCSFKGLKSHTRYTFSVAAKNKIGQGPAVVSAQVYLDSPGPLRAFADPASGYVGNKLVVVVLGAHPGQVATVTYVGHTHVCRLDGYAQCWVSLTPTSPGTHAAVVRLDGTARSVSFVTHP